MNDLTITKVKNGYVIYEHNRGVGVESERYVANGVEGVLEVIKGLLTGMEEENASD